MSVLRSRRRSSRVVSNVVALAGEGAGVLPQRPAPSRAQHAVQARPRHGRVRLHRQQGRVQRLGVHGPFSFFAGGNTHLAVKVRPAVVAFSCHARPPGTTTTAGSSSSGRAAAGLRRIAPPLRRSPPAHAHAPVRSPGQPRRRPRSLSSRLSQPFAAGLRGSVLRAVGRLEAPGITVLSFACTIRAGGARESKVNTGEQGRGRRLGGGASRHRVATAARGGASVARLLRVGTAAPTAARGSASVVRLLRMATSSRRGRLAS